tara:strand:+ start:1884 stop:2726 length:843 start_codon:yes stop_codon:yes gene_type:complete
MKQISLDLKTHLAGEVTTLVTCWRLTRRDGRRLAFTTHDQILRIDHVSFRPVNSFFSTAVSSSNALNVDNLAVDMMLSSDGIDERDIRAGLYDHAAIEIFQVNWQDLSQGKLPIRKGWLGEFSLKDDQFTVEIRGLSQKLQQTIGDVFSPDCRADLGGDRCHVNLEKVSRLGRVTEVLEPDRFQDSGRAEVDGWYDYGVLRWISGGNAGLKSEIKRYTVADFRLYDDLKSPIAVGDIYLAVAGCDKRAVTCKTKFDNFANFRGETAIPGTDALYRYPGLK